MRYTLFAGVNGAGKSSLYAMLSEKERAALGERVNVDEIVSAMGDWRDAKLQFMAGKIAVSRIREYIKTGVSFNQETTLSGLTVLKDISKAKERGFLVDMHYVFVDSPEVAKSRVRARVARGGHGIPDEDVERRFIASINNLQSAIPLCDKMTIYDNTETTRTVLMMERGFIIMQDKPIPKTIETLISR